MRLSVFVSSTGSLAHTTWSLENISDLAHFGGYSTLACVSHVSM